jgi:adenylate cyclase
MQRISQLLFKGWGRRTAWVALIAFVTVLGIYPAATRAPRLALFDFYERTFPRLEHANPVVIVAIDDRSLGAIGQWPWPRQIDAQLISRILSGHPAALGLDLILPERDRQSPEEWLRYAGAMPANLREAIRRLPSHDSILRDAIAKGPVVIGIAGLRLSSAISDVSRLAPFQQIPAAALKSEVPLPRFNAALRSIPILDEASAGHGVLSIDPDDDSLFRRIPMVSFVSNRLAPSLSLEVLRLTAKAPRIDLYGDTDGDVQGLGVRQLTFPTQKDGSIWINYSPHDPRRFISAIDLLSGRVDPGAFGQKLVLVGITALGTNDERMTPVGFMPGVEIHAQLLENILEGRLAHRPNWVRYAEPALTVSIGLLLIIVLPLLRIRWQALTGLIVILLLAALGIEFWRHSLALLDVATPAIGSALVFVSLLAGSYVETDKQRLRAEAHGRQVRGMMAHYMSPDLVEKLVKDPSLLKLSGETRIMTLLFCDIRGFTRIAEELKENPRQLSNHLNSFLTPMTDVIMSRQGTIDKYLGDCVMAFWNAPLEDPAHAEHACRSALAMVDALKQINIKIEVDARREQRPFHPLRVGIGLDTGECVVGNMGSKRALTILRSAIRSISRRASKGNQRPMAS